MDAAEFSSIATELQRLPPSHLARLCCYDSTLLNSKQKNEQDRSEETNVMVSWFAPLAAYYYDLGIAWYGSKCLLSEHNPERCFQVLDTAYFCSN